MFTYRMHTVLSVMHSYYCKHIVALGHNMYKLTRSPNNRKVARLIPHNRIRIMQGQRHLRILHNDGAMVSIISGQCTATEAVSGHRASFHFKDLCN